VFTSWLVVPPKITHHQVITMYNSEFPLNVKLDDFSVYLHADYKNVAKNVLTPTIFFSKLHLWFILKIQKCTAFYKDLAWRVAHVQLLASLTPNVTLLVVRRLSFCILIGCKIITPYLAGYPVTCCMLSFNPFLKEWWVMWNVRAQIEFTKIA
jgi:hypothetical protein